jgi:hypothetical protein
LEKVLGDVYLKYLREFKPFVDEASLGNIKAAKEVVFEAHDFEEDFNMSLTTLAARVDRGFFNREFVYKRHESGEETTSDEIARSWGDTGYLYRGKGQHLIICRPLSRSYASETLTLVTSEFEKVPFKDSHQITRMSAKLIPIKKFREEFGSHYGSVAVNMIWELRSLYSATANGFKSKLELMLKKQGEFEILGRSISWKD